MPKKRRYKTKYHHYGTVIGVLLVAIGGIFMILLGVEAFLRQDTPETYFLLNFITLDENISFLLSLTTIICGIGILIATVNQKPHSEDTVVWIIIAAILAIIGGTLGGLVVFGGVLIYLIFYFL